MKKLLELMVQKKREKCTTKVRFTDKEEAERIARNRAIKDKHIYGVYRCRFCGYLHIGKNKYAQANKKRRKKVKKARVPFM